MKNIGTIAAAAFMGVVLLLYMCTFQVRFTEVAIVKTFGKPAVEAVSTPGLKFKWPPPIQTVEIFDKRIRLLESHLAEARTFDGKNLVLTTFALWRIGDAAKFLTNFPEGVEQGEKKLRTAVISKKHEKIGQRSFDEFVSVEPHKRKIREIERSIRDAIAAEVDEAFGIEIVDFGIKKLSLPTTVTTEIFNAMKANEARKAGRYAAEGAARAQDILADAKAAEARIMAATGEKVAQIENEANRKVSEYYKEFDKHPELRMFLDGLRAMVTALSDRATIVLDSSQTPWNFFDENVRREIRPTGAGTE